MFGRDLQEDDQNRVSAALVSNDWQRVGIVASMRYEQDPALGHGNRAQSQDELVQRLPQLDLFLYKGRIVPQIPLELEAQFQSGYMYRASGTTGGRTEIYPKLSVPLDFGFGSVIGYGRAPSDLLQYGSQGEHTSLLAMYMDNSASPRQTGESRTMIDMDIQGYTEASRIWQLGDESSIPLKPENAGKKMWTAVRHEIQPRIRYSRTPHVDQEKNPFYLMEDRILPRDELTYSITNIVTRKGSIVSVTGEGDKQEARRSTFIRIFCAGGLRAVTTLKRLAGIGIGMNMGAGHSWILFRISRFILGRGSGIMIKRISRRMMDKLHAMIMISICATRIRYHGTPV